MTDRPIIFTGESVRAILEGRKTMTRLWMKLPKKGQYTYRGGWEPTTSGGGGSFYIIKGERVPAPERAAIWNQTTGTCIAAPCAVGDLLWVREAWRTESNAYDDLSPSDMDADYQVIYEADVDWRLNKTVGRYRNSLHMPRWASRITLRVTACKIERLQEISENDARAEGVLYVPGHGEITLAELRADPGYSNFLDCRLGFEVLWDAINAKRAPWASNPWVVAITFERI